jgi:hypothetical protein
MYRILHKDTTLITIVYAMAHGLSFFNKGLFWDDWFLYNNSVDIIINNFKQAGGIWTGYIHGFLLSFDNSILLYRGITFFSYLFSAIFLNGILKRIGEIDRL